MASENNNTRGAVSWIEVTRMSGLVCALVGASFWAASLKASVDTAVQSLASQSRDVGAIRDSIVELQADLRDVQRDILDRWRFSDEVDVWQQVGHTNPGFVVPILRQSSGDPRAGR